MIATPHDYGISDVCECATCGDGKRYNFEALKCHLNNRHGLPIGTESVLRLFLHIDSASHCTTIYECVIEGVKFWRTVKIDRPCHMRVKRLRQSR